MDKNQKHFTRQEISPGIILEKYQEVVNKKKFYVMKIDLELFNELDFCVDFSGSTKVKIDGVEGLVCKVRVPPFGKIEVARLQLERGWVMKTKFKIFLELPPLDVQRAQLEIYIDEIKSHIKTTKELGLLDTGLIDDSHIMGYLSDKGCTFMDHAFLPNEKSIHKNPDYLILNLNCIGHWRRFKTLQKAIRETRRGSSIGDLANQRISPNDVQQGKLNNAWLMSAIAALAYEPRTIQRLILTKVHNESGLIKIKLWNMSKWVTIALDDYFPCYPLSDTIFAQVENGKLWPLVLEKAFARKYGSYSKLDDGNSKDAFIDLTGCPTFTYKITDKQIQKWINSRELFKRIDEWKRIGYAMTITTRQQIDDLELDMVSGHVYTLVAVYYDKQIIQLRDPQKFKKFNGRYRQNSPLWTDDLKQEVKPVFNQNLIYLRFDEFLDVFEELVICKLNRWNELCCKGKFVKTVESDNEKIEHFSSRWAYKFELEKPAKIIIGIHQSDERIPGNRETLSNIDIGISLLNITTNGYNVIMKQDSRYERDVYLETRLDAGMYYVIPQSSGIQLLNNDQINEKVDIIPDETTIDSIIDDIFEKLDILNEERLTRDQLNTFFSFLKDNVEIEEVEIMLKHYRTEFPFVEIKKYTKKIFSIIFKNIYAKISENSRRDFFERLGYNADLLSVRSRVFGLTIHCQETIEVATEDALKTAIDQKTLKLILKNYGFNTNNGAKINLSATEVISCFFFNK